MTRGGRAALVLVLATGACVPRAAPAQDARFTYDQGGITRGARDRKELALIFTGGDFAEGATTILDALRERGVQASFFVTGGFIRHPEFDGILRRIVAEGHYLGPHSDAHLLYAPWDDRSRTLVTRDSFRIDLEKNLDALARYGRTREQMRFFIPPFEWYNRQIADWSRQMGLLLFNFTPGTRSHTDYMADRDPRFVPSRQIVASILEYDDFDAIAGYLVATVDLCAPELGRNRIRGCWSGD